MHRLLVTVSMCASVVASAQTKPTRMRECSREPSCELQLQRVVRLGSDVDSFDGMPSIVVDAGASGWVVRELLNGVPLAPLRRFDRSGKRLGDLGGVGRGPGELTTPWLVNATATGEIRVWDGRSRQLEFSSTGRPMITRTARNGLMGAHSWAWVTADEFVAIDLSPTFGGSPAIRRRSWDDRLNENLNVPSLWAGGPGYRILGETVTRSDGAFWVAEYQASGGRGFAIARSDTSGNVRAWLTYEPSWWAFAPSPPNDGKFKQVQARSSRVEALREVTSGVVLVLIGHPLEGGALIGPDLEMWTRYETRVLSIDTRTGSIVGQTRIRGFPISVSSSSDVAIAVPLDDGTAVVDIFRIRKP